MVEMKPLVEDLLRTFIVETRNRLNKDESWLDSIETHCTNMSATINSLETQIGQLANSIKGQSSERFLATWSQIIKINARQSLLKVVRS